MRRFWYLRCGLILIGCLFLLFRVGIPSIQAATVIHVSTTADEINNDGDCSLREALRAANLDVAVDACPAGSGADTIDIPAGTYLLSIAVVGDDEGLTGDLDLVGEVTLQGHGANSTIIDANALDRVFQILPSATVTIEALTVRHGQVPSGSPIPFGGGILNAGALTLSHAVVTDNFAESGGGGIQNWIGGALSILYSTISNNSVELVGGGISDGWSGSIFVDHSFISHNTATVAGGVHMAQAGTLVIANSTFVENVGQAVGAVYNSNIAQVTITNSTFYRNDGGNFGGGIFNQYTGPVTVTYSTFAENRATRAGGIMNNVPEGTLTIGNTILSNNVGGNCSPGNLGGHITDGGGNLQYPGLDCGNAIPSADPLLGPLENNGGATPTMALLPNSPAIDAAIDALCPATDQRDVTRPQDGNADGSAICDVGAYERTLIQAVAIDIKPDSANNVINLKSQGVVTIAILSTASLDATQVNVAGVCFGDAEDVSQRDCTEAHGKGHYSDVNGDGRTDLVMHFEVQETGIDLDDEQACLTGALEDGTTFEGCDTIHTR